MSNIAIAPSILSADFCNLERDLKAIANATWSTSMSWIIISCRT